MLGGSVRDERYGKYVAREASAYFFVSDRETRDAPVLRRGGEHADDLCCACVTYFLVSDKGSRRQTRKYVMPQGRPRAGPEGRA